MQPQRPDHSSRRRISLVSGVLAASLLGAGAVAAQSPSTNPTPSGSPGTPSTPSMGNHQRPMGGGPVYRDGRGYGRPGAGPVPGGPRVGGPGIGGRPGMGGPGLGRGFGRGDLPRGPGGPVLRRGAPSAISVSAITAPVISLTTDDGWTRDVDTTGVTITRNGQTITLADIHVGDDIRLGQTRNADGTWTITRIDIELAVVQGTVASVGTDSFTVTETDGSVVTVHVADTTRWLARRGNTAGLSSLAVGAAVVAEGVRAADGSIDAIAVGVRGTAPSVPVVPSVSPSPAAAQG
jgi:hypothetical protein